VRTGGWIWRHWEPIPALVSAPCTHACCAVRGSLVVFGVSTHDHEYASSVEMSSEGGEFVELPPLSCGGILCAVAIAVKESDSAAGQVLLLGGGTHTGEELSTVQLVDLDTGVCTPQPALLHGRMSFAAAGLPDGRIICVGGFGGSGPLSTTEMWGPPVQGAVTAAWTWRALPAMSVGLVGCSGCMMSDGRFAVLKEHVKHRHR